MISIEKDELRKKIRELKRQFSKEEKRLKSKIIIEKIEKLHEFQNSKVIMAYWSMSDEVFTHDFVLKWYNKKIIILPVVKDEELELKTFTGIENMTQGQSFNIGEPTGDIFSEVQNIDFIIVPGVAFDKNKNRLGRGKAYYDKLLKEVKAIKVGVCFDFQLVETVPVDQHDIKMDLVVSD